MATVAPDDSYMMKVDDSWSDLQLRLQADAYRNSIRLEDFMAPFDHHHRGVVSESNFERALTAAHISVNSEELDVIRRHFGLVEKSQALIDFKRFSDLINTGKLLIIR